MRETPADDFYNENVRVQPHGCVPHTTYAWELKPHSAGHHKRDVFKWVSAVRVSLVQAQSGQANGNRA